MRLLARRLLVLGTALGGLIAVGEGTAVAQPTWALQGTPNPVVPTASILGVSCTSGTACVEVGYTSNSAGTNLTLAEGWNGSSWTVKPTPSPAGAIYSFLSGVSCTSGTACMAVGYYGNSTGTELPLAESWNGTSWTIQSPPVPSGATFTALSGVSCTSTTACTAVGNYGPKKGTELTLAETWNGTSWSVETTPNPTGATVSALSSVSCPTATACSAVGIYFDKSGNQFTLAEGSNGSSWSVQTTQNPGGTVPTLSGVSCQLATACTAVGDYFNSSGSDVTLAEGWNGTSWSIQPTPNPSDATLSALTGVSCTSSTACTAVGDYFTASDTQLSLAEAWNGTSWSIQPTPNPSGAVASPLVGVSCVSTGGCFGVGDSTNAGGTSTVFALGYYGPYGWLIVSSPSPNGAATSYLSAVSCTSATGCTGVGYSIDSSGAQTALAEAWNGTTWAIQPLAVPSGAKSSSLSGVTCVAATGGCLAVGSYVNSAGTTVTLAEGYYGPYGWLVTPTPNPVGATLSSLSSVSCYSPTLCTAVGRTVSSSQSTLAEGWNGSGWTLQHTSTPTGAKASELTGISCVSATGGCLAVGYEDNSAGTRVTLAEGYYGPLYGWLVVATPNPTGATSSILSGISCSSATSCTAVGSFNNSTGTFTTAEGWNGSGFALQSTSNPGATLNALTGVSCTSTTACTGVGYDTNSSGVTVTLAEGWNGTSWTAQTTPNPPVATASVLYGVSCTAATSCTAIGRYNNGVPVTLAEAD